MNQKCNGCLFVVCRVLYASLQKAAFLLQPPPFKAVIQDIELTNTFDFPLAIYDAEFPSDVTLFEVCACVCVCAPARACVY